MSGRLSLKNRFEMDRADTITIDMQALPIIAGVEREKNLEILADLNRLMTDASLCAMGGLTPMPVMSALRRFPEDFRRAPQRAAAE